MDKTKIKIENLPVTNKDKWIRNFSGILDLYFSFGTENKHESIYSVQGVNKLTHDYNKEIDGQLRFEGILISYEWED
jgi:hypothetical protein